jgi:16S rRNA (guanine527-N7)-methyltransferase
MPLPDLMKLIRKNFSKEQHNALPNGIFVLKGGDLTEEIKPFKKIAEVTSLDTYFDEEWFKEDKKLIYVPV